MSYTIEQIRKAVVEAAENDFRQPIRDFDNGQQATPHRIQALWEDAGWTFYLHDKLDGMYRERAADGSYMQWCGIAVAAWAKRVGDFVDDQKCVDLSLKQPVAKNLLPSTYRLNHPANFCADCPRFEHPGKLEIKAGDVITVGDGIDGSHIALVREDRQRKNTVVRTVEGNAHGTFPSGETGEGVVHQSRDLDEIKSVHRFTLDHFEGEALQ